MVPSFEFEIDCTAPLKLSSSEGWQCASQRRARIAGSAAGRLGEVDDVGLPCELHMITVTVW